MAFWCRFCKHHIQNGIFCPPPPPPPPPTTPHVLHLFARKRSAIIKYLWNPTPTYGTTEIETTVNIGYNVLSFITSTISVALDCISRVKYFVYNLLILVAEWGSPLWPTLTVYCWLICNFSPKNAGRKKPFQHHHTCTYVFIVFIIHRRKKLINFLLFSCLLTLISASSSRQPLKYACSGALKLQAQQLVVYSIINWFHLSCLCSAQPPQQRNWFFTPYLLSHFSHGSSLPPIFTSEGGKTKAR